MRPTGHGSPRTDRGVWCFGDGRSRRKIARLIVGYRPAGRDKGLLVSEGGHSPLYGCHPALFGRHFSLYGGAAPKRACLYFRRVIYGTFVDDHTKGNVSHLARSAHFGNDPAAARLVVALAWVRYFCREQQPAYGRRRPIKDRCQPTLCGILLG